MKILLVFLSIFSILPGNYAQDKLVGGTFEAFYAATNWKITLNSNGTYIGSANGHIGNIELKEDKYIIAEDTLILYIEDRVFHKYLIDGDSCLIDLENRHDYCKQWPDEWRSRLRNINYPQLPSKDIKLKKDVEWMIQIALNNIEILKYIPDTFDYLFIQEYYEINKSSKLNLNWQGNKVKFMSKQEIKGQNVEEYIVIKDITVGLKSASISFHIMPEYWIGTHENFKKKNGSWEHIK